MKTLGILFLIVFAISHAPAQNKDTAAISITGYRLHEGTFSWRGTNTYFDRTPWDSSPFTEGHLRQYNGNYIQNFRLLYPANYDPSYPGGYPLMLVLHGAGERGNCWNKGTHLECYYGDLTYNANTQPTNATEDQINNLLNNDHNLTQGAGAHLSARNRAGTLQPNDPGMPERAFPGFVLYPQNLNGWTVNEVRSAIRTVRLLIKKHNIDQDRVYISGLSNGGRGVLFALVEADWLFAAAATQSAIPDHSAYRTQIDSAVNIPIWMFQGGQDTSPTPPTTKETIRIVQAAGGTARYTEYPTIGHGTWNTAYAEPDYFSWFTSRNKSDIHVYYANANVCGTNDVGAKLSMPQGFADYEWEKDGVLIPGAKNHILIANEAGVYRGRFSRAGVWNNWSAPVNVGVQSPVKPVLSQVGSVMLRDLNGKATATLQGPEGAANYYWYKDNVLTTLPNARVVQISAGDCSSGPCQNNGQYTLVTSAFDNCPSQPSNVKGVFFEDQAPLTIPVPTNFTGTLSSPTEILLRWNDVSALEKGYEIWRRKSTDNSSIGWTFVTLTNENAILYTDKGLESNTIYWYKIRAVSNTARSNYAPGNSKTAESHNLIIATGTDQTPPTTPSNLTASLIDTHISTQTASIRLRWDAATDDTGIKEYQVRYGTTTRTFPGAGTTAIVDNLPLNRDLNFSVYAVDLAGNVSAASSPAQERTYIDGFFWQHNTGGFTDIRDIPATAWTSPEFTGRSANLTLEPATQDDYFNFRFYGYINISTAGEYLFRIRSNDGIQLYLDGNLVARRNGTVGDGVCATTNFNPDVPAANLTAGLHTLEIRYFQYTGDKCLSMQWQGPDAGPNPTRFYDVPDTRIRSYEGYTPPDGPEIPQALVATADGMTRIDLSWTYPGTDAPEFEIQRALAEEGPFSVLNRVTAYSYADTTLSPGTTYYYRIRAVNTEGVSEFTPVVSATTETDSEAPTAPSNLTLVSKTVSTASLAWTASTDNTGIDHYEIWANGAMAATTPLTYYLLDDLEPFTSYSVYVVAVDANDNKSSPSNTVEFETTEPLVYFSKPTGNLNDPATWGTNADGSGDSPSSFDISGLFLYISNRTNTSIGGAWDITSPASRVVVSAGVTLTVESSFNGTVNAAENSLVILANPNTPDFDELSPTSTVRYNQNVSEIEPGFYGNLVLNGTGSKTFAAGETKVGGEFSVASGLAIKGQPGNTSKIVLMGNTTFTGTRSETTSNVTVGLRFAGTGEQIIQATSGFDLFEISAAPATTVTLNTGDESVTVRLGSATGGGISLENGSSLSIGGNTLLLTGAATINRGTASGVLRTSGATIDLSSSSNAHSNLFMDTAANDLARLRINLTGSGRLNVQSQIEITESVKIVTGDLNANGNVILLSNTDRSANLEEIGLGGAVVGDMIVQRHMSAKERTYRYMSSPVAGVRIADWQEYFPITGPFEGASTGRGLSTSSSLFYYDEPNWVGYPTTTNQALIQKGVGYAVLVRNASEILLENRGNPHQGDVTFSLKPPIDGDSDSGWNLLGNPYASTIAWSNDTQAWQKNRVSSVVAVMNNFNSTSGQFMYYDAATGLGTGKGGVLAGGRIAQGQAFYVQTTGQAPALTITERAKSTGQQEFYREEATVVSHFMLRLSSREKDDAAIVSFTDYGHDEFESDFDGLKKKNTGMFSLATQSSNGVALAINNMSGAFCSRRIAVDIQDAAAGSYTLSAENLSTLEGVGNVILHDRFTNKSIDLLKEPAYAFEVTADASSQGAGRFEIVLDRPELDLSITPVAEISCGEQGKITLAGSQSGATYTLLAENGNRLASHKGTGGNLAFTIPKSALKQGANSFAFEVSFDGCSGQMLSSGATLMYEETPYIISNDVTVCQGEKAQIEVSASVAGADFTWFDANGKEIKGATGNTLESGPINTETYLLVSAAVPGGCESARQIIVITPVEMVEPALHRVADTLYADVVAERFVWLRDGEEIATTVQPQLSIDRNGTYSLMCITGGCTKISETMVISDIGPAPGNLSVYPNPTTSDNVFVQGTVDAPEVGIVIFDVTGREVYRQTHPARTLEQGLKIDGIRALHAGVYFLVVEEESRNRKFRVVIQR